MGIDSEGMLISAVHEVDELAFRVDAEPVADLELILPAGG